MIQIPKQLQKPEFRFLLLRNKGKEPLPQMTGWQKDSNVPHDNAMLQYHINGGGNYGIIGGFGNLILIDSDSEEVNKICQTLPETFTIKTGSPESYKIHYYYIADRPIKPIRLSGQKIGDLGDVRSVGQYVVAPNSIHPKGGIYEVIKDVGIAKVSEDFIREKFSGYIDKKDNTELNKDFPIDTRLRNSKFIRECRVPDYLLNNKIKGNTGKNWKLFPYLIDIMHNRQCNQQAYEILSKTQGHQLSAVKGWVKLAHQGKLAKTSCKKMRDYLEKYHEDKVEEICGDCPLFQKEKELIKIKTNKNYTVLQKKVLTYLALKEREKATELIVQEIEKENHIYTTRDDIKSEMWVYNEGIYVPQGKSFVREFSRKILEENFTQQLSNSIIAKIEADTYIEHDNFFNQNYIDEVPVKNGILNIFTRELKEYNPKKIFFNKIPIKYNSSSECFSIINHFETILKTEEDVLVLLEMFGYLLLKEYRIEKAFMFVGKGRNGKSKTIDLMKRFVDPSNCSSLPLKSLTEESFSLSELFGKMANLSADLSNSDLKETGMIKSLIGRDFIQAKRKFLRDLNFVNYAKMVFACNELPRIYDTTDGFWTKWVLMEFPYKFVTQQEFNTLSEKEQENHRILDPDIIDKITSEEELSGLLNLALDGLDRLLKNRDFSYSKNTSEVKEMWIRKSDSFTAFCYDHLEGDFDSSISKKDLRRFFYKYCRNHKLRGASDKGIKITLENLFGVSETQNGDMRERVWEGIQLKNMEVLD